MANKSLKGLQVAFGIIGTIAAVVIVFAYAVSGDIYTDEHADLSQQSSAQFSSTVSGQDVPEAIDSTTTLPASSESDIPSNSLVPPAPPTQSVADTKQPANSDSLVANAPSDDGELTDKIGTLFVPNIVTHNNARLQEVDNDNSDNGNTQPNDRQEQSTAKIEKIATTTLSDNRDNVEKSTNHDEGQKEKKNKHDDHESGKGDGQKHKDKAKGKGHHKD